MAELETAFGGHASILPIAAEPKRSGLDISTLRIEQVTSSNIDILWNELLPLQGDAHLTTIKGTEQAFRSALLSETPEHKILNGLILRTDDGENVGYVLVSDMHTPGGQTVYLEDNFIKEEYRGGGLGTLLFDVLKVVAGPDKNIACTVDDSKKNTQNFYLNRVGMQMETVPLLGMGDFELGNTDTGSIVITSREATGPDVKSIEIHGASVKPDSVRPLTHDDIDQLVTLPEENFRIGAQIADKGTLLSTFRDAVDHERNFGLVSLDEAGNITTVSLVSRTFSTFNNFSRANLGPSVSTTGKLPAPEAILNHVSFCQALPFASRIELKLDAEVAKTTELSKVAQGCVSNMTEENADSFERGFNTYVTTADYVTASARLPAKLKADLHGILNKPDVVAPSSRKTHSDAHAGFTVPANV